MMSEQLELFVWPALERLPWGGARPRDLTRGAKLLYLRREPGDVSSPPDPAQCEMFLKNQARRYAGAPLLRRLSDGNP